MYLRVHFKTRRKLGNFTELNLEVCISVTYSERENESSVFLLIFILILNFNTERCQLVYPLLWKKHISNSW